MPRTISKCSGRRNDPCCSRCATIRSARTLPMPGSFSSSAVEAVLILIDEALSLWPGVPAVMTRDAFCEAKCLGSLAQDVTIVSTLRVTSAKTSLLMGDLVSSMQTNVCEEFSDAPLTCAICQKSKILKNLNRALTVCPQSFPQEREEIFAKQFS